MELKMKASHGFIKLTIKYFVTFALCFIKFAVESMC